MEFSKGFEIQIQNINVSTLNNNMIQNEWNYEMMNISSVWSQGLTGRGINIGVYKVLDSTTGQVLKNIKKVKGNAIYDLYLFDKKV